MLILARVLAVAVAITVVGTGCATYSDRTREVNKATASGNIAGAADAYGRQADKCGKSDMVIWHLEAGASYRATGDFTNSNRHLEDAAAQIDVFEQQAKVKVGLEFLGLMTNQQNLPYEGRSYDRIMLYTYKVLNDLALGQIEKARPDIIHAYQCQQDAVEVNERRIEKAQDALRNNPNSGIIATSEANPAFRQALAPAISETEGFQVYRDYVNPFTVYLDGLYFLHNGVDGSDLERARKSLNRVQEFIASNKFVQADLQLAESAGTTPPTTGVTYVIFETGRAASLEQVRVNLPFIINGQIVMVTAAFPKLVLHNDQVHELIVKVGELEERTTTIANMDSIVALDFKNEWPVTVTKAVISSAMKAARNYELSRKNSYAGLFTRLFDVMTNIADTRSWQTLPKEFQIARIPTPTDRKITLSTPGSTPVEVALLDGTINVVCAKSTTASSPLLVNQFKLK